MFVLKPDVTAEKAAPSTSLMNACLEAYDKKKDPRLLPPALGGMSRQQAQSFLPSLLLLEAPGFKAALHRMLMPLPQSGCPAGFIILLPSRLGGHFVDA